MADPHIKEDLDIFDIITVIIYRCGFVIAAPAILFLPWYPEQSIIATLCAAACCASSLHIYMKPYRLVLQVTTWIGLVLMLFNFNYFALGGALVTLGGLGFKEYFCFKVPALNLQPIFCALLWFSLVFNWHWIAVTLAIIIALLFALLAFKKWQMPLHFDIGDKSKYEV